MANNIVAFRTAHGTYLSARTETNGQWPVAQMNDYQSWEHFQVGMGTNGVTLYTAHNRYISAYWGSAPRVRQVLNSQSLEQFGVVRNNNGTISLVTAQGLYISARSDGTVNCVNENKEWEQFQVINI